MRVIKKYLLNKYLPVILGKSCPSRIPRTGERGEKMDCFIAYRYSDESDLVFTSIEAEKVIALEYDGNSYSIERVVKLDEIDASSLTISYYRGLWTIEYRGIWAFFRGYVLGLTAANIRAKELSSGVKQWLFNRRTLVVDKRLSVLREIVEAAVAGSKDISAMMLVERKYGLKAFLHPGFNDHVSEFEFYLDGLVDTGELERQGMYFSPTGNAIKTIEESDEQDRKHKANFRIQGILAVITLLGAIAAAGQAGMVKFPVLLDFTDTNQRPKELCQRLSEQLQVPPDIEQ